MNDSMRCEEICNLIDSRKIDNYKRIGYVYLIESTCGTRVKIGRSFKPKTRINNIRTISGGVGRNYISVLVNDSVAIESSLHLAFSKNRSFGEWFYIDFDKTVNLVETICKKFNISNHVKEEMKKDKNENANKMFEAMLDCFDKKEKEKDVNYYIENNYNFNTSFQLSLLKEQISLLERVDEIGSMLVPINILLNK